jgi:hypothetical protein
MIIVAFLFTGSMPVDPLVATWQAVHRDYEAQLLDKFADITADASVVGQKFKITSRLHSGDVLGAPPGPWFTYSDGKLRLVFSLSQEYGSPTSSEVKYAIGIVGGSRVAARSYVGSNAYGATARVQVQKLLENGIAFIEGPQGERVLDTRNRDDLLRPSPKDYSFDLEMAPAAARKIAQDSALLVEGAIATLPDGKLSVCRPIYGAPRIDHPLEVYGESCSVAAVVSRIAFIRSSTGEIMKEWKLDTAH